MHDVLPILPNLEADIREIAQHAEQPRQGNAVPVVQVKLVPSISSSESVVELVYAWTR